ncbi:MAG: protein kinase [Nocardioides sp.]|jgi:hypothetical protein
MTRFPQIGDDFGPYRIVGLLGQGAMGVVFAATEVGLGRQVALKVLSPQLSQQPEYRARFEREATSLARVDSPHIVAIFSHGAIDDCLYIAAQYVSGGDLGDRIQQQGPLAPLDALTVAAQVASALAAAHQVGVLHRDVKPRNVLLRPAGDGLHAYLCDFGIAAGQDAQLTATGVVAGTFGYLAPERCRGEQAAPASDLYSLGCLLWNCLTGSLPYEGSATEQVLAHVSGPVPQLRETDGTSVALNRVLRTLMAKDPQARYPDAIAARDDLLRVRQIVERAGDTTLVTAPLAGQHPGEQPTVARVPDTAAYALPPTPTTNHTSRKWVVPVAVGSVVAVLAAAGGVFALTRGGDDESTPKAAVTKSTATPTAPTSSASTKPKKPRKTLTATATVTMTAGTAGSAGVLSGRDANGDAHDDFVIQTSDGVAAVTLSGDDASPEVLWEQSTDNPSVPVVREDFDGDGLMDLASMSFVEGGWLVEVSTGIGSRFESPGSWVNWEGDAEQDSNITAADFTGDGLADLAVARSTPGGIAIDVLESTGSSFAAPVTWASVPKWTWANMKIVAGDFTGDGIADLAELGKPWRGGVDVRIFESYGSGFAPNREWMANKTWDWSKTHPLVADIDGDGVVDMLMLRDEGSTTAYALISNGSEFEDSYPLGTVSSQSLEHVASVSVDANQDGRTDLVVLGDLTSGSGGTIQSFLSNGSGLDPASSGRTDFNVSGASRAVGSTALAMNW